ncbi:MAG: hypothetical protein ACUVTQ_07160 [Desulfotomaculales bacterium]
MTTTTAVSVSGGGTSVAPLTCRLFPLAIMARSFSSGVNVFSLLYLTQHSAKFGFSSNRAGYSVEKNTQHPLSKIPARIGFRLTAARVSGLGAKKDFC